jgi:ankyrin repeat protein
LTASADANFGISICTKKLGIEAVARDNSILNELLYVAAMNGDAIQCARLLSDGIAPNTFDELGKTPLHYAAEGKHVSVVELLIANGADVNAHHEPSIGNTPITEIAGNCSLQLAQVLIDAGADPTIRGWMQLNALDIAKNRRRGDGPRVYELLLRAAKR